MHDVARRPHGLFHLEVWKGGRLIEVYDGPNVVVTGADAITLALLAGVGQPITQIGFGSGSAPASVGNAALLTPYLKAVNNGSSTGAAAVFHFELDGPENNNTTIWEFGLLTAAGLLFARKVRTTGLIKTPDVSLVGAWTITF